MIPIHQRTWDLSHLFALELLHFVQNMNESKLSSIDDEPTVPLMYRRKTVIYLTIQNCGQVGGDAREPGGPAAQPSAKSRIPTKQKKYE